MTLPWKSRIWPWTIGDSAMVQLNGRRRVKAMLSERQRPCRNGWTILDNSQGLRRLQGMVNHMCLSPPNPMAYGISSWSRMCQTQSWTIPNRGLWNWVSYFYLRWFEIAPTGLATGIVWYWVYHINKTNTTEPYKTTMLGKQHLHFRWIFRDVSMVSQNFHIKTIVFLAIWRSPKIGVAPIILHLMFGFSMK